MCRWIATCAIEDDVRAKSLESDQPLEERMRSLLVAATLLGAAVLGSPPAPSSSSCYVVAIALLVDDVKDVRDIKYHRVVVTGIRKLDAVNDSTDLMCQPRDAMVPLVMRQEVDGRFRGMTRKPQQVQRSFVVQHSSLAVVENEVRRFATVARTHAGSFKRVEAVAVDVSIAPRSAELPLPALATSEADAAACVDDNKELERSNAKYRWAC